MIIDMHVHIWKEETPGQDAAGVVRMLDNAKVTRGICSYLRGGYYPTQDDISVANRYVADSIARYPDRLLGYVYLNPANGAEFCVEQMKRAIEDWHFAGVKLWVSVRFSDPQLNPIVEQAIRYDVPMLCHTWLKTTGNLPDESTALDLAVLANRYPEGKFMMAHLCGDWEWGVKAIKPCKNVWVDASGTPTESGQIEFAVQQLGAERVVFGSDVPVASIPINLGKIDGACLTPEQRDRILWRNVYQAYHLDRHGVPPGD